jgi:hypothetical protein
MCWDFVKIITIGVIAGGFFHPPTGGRGFLTKDVTIIDAYTGDTYYVSGVPVAAASCTIASW